MGPTVVIKPFATLNPCDPYATSRYMQDLRDEGHKVPHDDFGPMSGSMNCHSANRTGCLKEISTLLRLYGNPRSTQAAEHNAISYPLGFRPTRAQIERDIRIDMKKRGMGDHLVIWDAHGNTGNFHVHYLLCRVSPTPNATERYHLADDGIVKVSRKDNKRNRVRTRTDEAACRQSAIAEINALYGWKFDGLTHDADGNPQPRTKEKDRHSDKTRAGERKRGAKSKERQLSDVMKEVFDKAAAEASISTSSFWHIADRKFASKAMEMTIKIENGKPTGGFVTGPDNRKCGFGKVGKDYSTPALVKKYGPPTLADAAAFNEYDLEPFEYRPNDLTPEEAKKHLLPVFKDATTWSVLLENVEHLGMRIARSGGGLVVIYNGGRDTIKASEVSNKFSLSRLEKVLGACPLPKSAPTQATRRDLVIQDVEPILARHVRLGGSLSELRDALGDISTTIEEKIFTATDGRQIPYLVFTKDGISVPLSQVARTNADKPVYTLSELERLNRAAKRAAEVHTWLHSSPDNGFEERYSRYLDNFIANTRKAKEKKVGMLTLFAAVAKFIKTKGVAHVYTNSPEVDREEPGCGEAPRAEPLFQM